MDRYIVEGTIEKETPPSITKDSWWLNICSKPGNRPPNPCSDHDLICLVTEVVPSNSEPVLTQVVEFPQAVTFSESEISGNLNVDLQGAKWGSRTLNAQITYVCAHEAKDKVSMADWYENKIHLEVRGPSGCLRDIESVPEKRSGSKFSTWLLWIWINILLFSLLYSVIVIYSNSRWSTIQDFREELVERFNSFITLLPHFVKEVANKIISGGSTSRGGYSAV